ncbi:MAG: rubredoxin [Firmicutes bacterium]|jgi:hypothetical protein|nr:rubredoxin [Bacillota bacterium]MDD4337328.1 rubredoxin [Bacillota bacterium]MDD4791675.1 rubredoxin [Bacillota bacterium]
MKLWRCSVCGFIHDGNTPAERCPKCGAPRERFSEVGSKETEAIKRSRFTNDLHCRLVALMEEVEEIAEAGIDDDLDPGCVAVFKRAREQAWIIGQSAKAEIQAHVGKGKWG